MSELSTQTAIQADIQALSEFGTGTVVINDWRILDQSTSLAPYAIIQNADNFNVEMPCNTTWQTPVTIIVRFTDWQESLNEFRDTRQAVLDGIANAAYTVNITANSGIGEIHDKYNDDPAAMPVFLSQRIIITAIDQD
jgi:hypothetical protein